MHTMMVRLTIAALLLLAACSASKPPLKTSSPRSVAAADALRAGEFREAERLASHLLSEGTANSEALVVRALGRYQGAAQEFFGEIGILLEEADDFERFDHARIRKAFARAELELEAVEQDLKQAAADENFSLELCPACWEQDWNRNGRIDERDRRLLEIEFASDGTEIPEGDPRRRPIFRFDVGDIHWARAMIAFQRAGLNILMAYDGTELDKLFELSIFGDAPTVLVIRIKLLHSERIAKARSLILIGLKHSDAERLAYLAETDDDREWVPNPRQKSSPVPLAVDEALYETWAGVISDVRGLIDGDTGISAGEVLTLARMPKTPTGYLDVGRMLSHPKDIVLDLGAIARHDIDGPKGDAEALMRDLFGDYYVAKMKPTPLVGRLTRMAGELIRGEESLDRKLRYLFWIN
jgi:hypothetical protein